MNAPPLPRWRVFPALALGTLMAVLDISIVNIALPTLSRVFHAPLTSVEWVVLSYVVTITGLLLTLGRVADATGRRRVYVTGMVVFMASSALCAAAPSVAWLIAARALQGLGAAMMTANSAAILIANFPEHERGRALGAFGAMVGVGLALGPPLGGLIVGHLSWRWIFLINLPLGALALWQLRTRVPEDVGARRGMALELPSAALWCGALVCLMLALSRGPDLGWGAPGVWPLFAASVACFALFAVVDTRAATPLLPVRLLLGPFGIAALLTLLGQAMSISVGFHLPIYFEEVLGFGAAKSGTWLAVMPLLALLFAPAAGRWSDQFGARPLLVAGTAIALAGFLVLSGLGVTLHAARILGGMALIGAGLGIFTVPNASALLSTVPREQLGLGSGMQATMRNLGIAGGAAGMAAVVASRYAAHGGIGALTAGAQHGFDRLAFAQASRDGYRAMAFVAVVALILALLPAAGGGRKLPGTTGP